MPVYSEVYHYQSQLINKKKKKQQIHTDNQESLKNLEHGKNNTRNSGTVLTCDFQELFKD